jgi:tripartite-type tricarboxylate transporter receptor subunit TctC
MRALLFVLGLSFSLLTQAQSWPAKPVRTIVPYPPGGSTDLVMRTLAERLSRTFNQQFIVENRGGAGGAVGTAEVARAAPDGYTFAFVGDPAVTLHLVIKDIQYNIERDFVPVTQVTTQPLALVVHNSLPVRTVDEFIGHAKANPGKVFFAHAGAGTGQHMSGELLKKMAGIEMTHVPYKGGGPAVQDLVAGQVLVGMLASTPVIPHHRSGRVKILAFTTKERFPPMPEIPTLHESGLPGFNTSQWLGILAPAKTPREIVARLQAEIARVLASPDVRKRFEEAALLTVGSTPEQFADVISQDLKRWNKLAAELGLKPE